MLAMMRPQSVGTMPERVRKRALITLLVDVFCIYTGFFMVIPLISVHYIDGLGWAAASVGLVLAARQLLQQGLTVLGGMLADQIGTKSLILTGLFIRVLGFVMLAWATTLPLLFAACALAAIGGALFESPRAAAIAALTLPEERQRFYSLSGALGGIGLAVGPLIGAALLHVDFGVVALVAAAVFSLNLVQTAIWLPSVRVATSEAALSYGVGLALRDRPFMIFTLLMAGFWFMWVQLNMALPLLAGRLTGSTDTVGFMYAVNSAMTITLQYPLIRVFGRTKFPMATLAVGMVLVSLGLGSVLLATGLPSLLACVALFSLGGLLVQPTQQTVTAAFANPAALGSYFGVSSLSLAIGGALGNYFGGVLYEVGEQTARPALPWLVFASTGLVAAAGLWWLYHQQRAVLERPATPDTQLAIATDE